MFHVSATFTFFASRTSFSKSEVISYRKVQFQSRLTHGVPGVWEGILSCASRSVCGTSHSRRSTPRSGLLESEFFALMPIESNLARTSQIQWYTYTNVSPWPPLQQSNPEKQIYDFLFSIQLWMFLTFTICSANSKSCPMVGETTACDRYHGCLQSSPRELCSDRMKLSQCF